MEEGGGFEGFLLKILKDIYQNFLRSTKNNSQSKNFTKNFIFSIPLHPINNPHNFLKSSTYLLNYLSAQPHSFPNQISPYLHFKLSTFHGAYLKSDNIYEHSHGEVAS